MPILTDLDKFRLELGDRDGADPLFNDDEAQYFIDKRPGRVLLAVADACDALATRFGREHDFEWQGSQNARGKFSRSQMAKAYAEQAKTLRARDRKENPGAPWRGGKSHARKDALAGDPDRVQPAFQRGQFDGSSTGL